MPNTLAQLNAFSNQSYAFEDARAYSITFSANATSNQSVSVSEDQSWLSPVGINITGMTSQPGNITYNIDTSNISGNAILTWPTLPSSVSSSSPSTGVYRLTGFIDNVVWDQIKSPTIVAKDRETNFVYSANIQYPSTANTANTNTWSWTNSVTISNTHSEMTNATNFTYDEDTPKTIPGTPTITDAYSGPLPHTLVITPNTANAVFSLSMSGNTSLNPVTKALTIVDTKANINTGLGNLWLVPASNTNANYSINYSLTNPVSNLNTQVNQAANIGNTYADFTMTTNYTYAEDVATQLVFAVDDGDATATTFTISLDQTLGTDGTLLVNGVNAGLGNLASFTGNRTAFNAANITFVPYPDTTDNINITANVVMANVSGNVNLASNVVSTITNTGGHAQYNLGGGYTENTLFNFANIITDTDPLANSYTIGLQQTSGNIGQWYVNGNLVGYANSVYTVSNTRANINSSNISWYPSWENRGNVTFTYNQTKVNSIFGNITQASNVANTKTCVANVNGLTNATVSRNYSSNVANTTIYSASTPTITDGTDVGQTYEVRIQKVNQGGSVFGAFGNSIANAIALIPGSGSGYYAITGNITTVNAALANVVFAPASSVNHNAVTSASEIVFYRAGQLSTKTFVGNVVGANLSYANSSYTFSSAGTFTPTVSEVYYGGGMLALAIGGGGAGGVAGQLNNTGPNRAGGGGGGGQATIVDTINTAIPITNTNYSVVIGSGGKTAAANGANSYIANAASSSNVILAVGGGGANGLQGVGGNSANGLFLGGSAQSVSPYNGGGGAGATQNGGGGYSGGAGAGGFGYLADDPFLGGSSTAYGNGGYGGYSNISGSNGADGTGWGGGGAGATGGSIGTGGNGIVFIKVVKV